MSGAIESLGGFEHRQIFPQPGWVEHDAGELLDHVRQLAERAGEAVAPSNDNQGATVSAWGAASGGPIFNPLVWEDDRRPGMIQRREDQGAGAPTPQRARPP